MSIGPDIVDVRMGADYFLWKRVDAYYPIGVGIDMDDLRAVRNGCAAEIGRACVDDPQITMRIFVNRVYADECMRGVAARRPAIPGGIRVGFQRSVLFGDGDRRPRIAGPVW